MRRSRLQPLSLTEDCANPFQAVLQDAKKESSGAGKLTNSKYYLSTCGQQPEDKLDIYIQTPLEDKNHKDFLNSFQNLMCQLCQSQTLITGSFWLGGGGWDAVKRSQLSSVQTVFSLSSVVAFQQSCK